MIAIMGTESISKKCNPLGYLVTSFKLTHPIVQSPLPSSKRDRHYGGPDNLLSGPPEEDDPSDATAANLSGKSVLAGR